MFLRVGMAGRRGRRPLRRPTGLASFRKAGRRSRRPLRRLTGLASFRKAGRRGRRPLRRPTGLAWVVGPNGKKNGRAHPSRRGHEIEPFFDPNLPGVRRIRIWSIARAKMHITIRTALYNSVFQNARAGKEKIRVRLRLPVVNLSPSALFRFVLTQRPFCVTIT